MRSSIHQLSIFGLLCGVAACGKVSSPAQVDGDIPGGDGQGPISCEFAKAGTACAFPPHVSVEPMRTCFTAAAPPVLDPPVGATLTFRKSGAAYQVDCSPGCGGAATTIPSQEALFQTNAPLIELFCFQKVNIPAGVTVRADPTFDRAIALLARDAITIGGSIDLSGAEAMDVQGGAGGPGGYAGGGRIAPYNGGGPCGGVGGSPQGGSATTGSGGGGGGNAGAGGNSGAGNPSPAGVAGGCSRPYAKLEGGSGGGGGGTGVVIYTSGTNFGSQFAGSGGGGAVALISRTSVTVASTATIAANGAQGHIIANNSSFNYNQLGGTGGGAGGTIVLAAPAVDVAGALRVQGGNGRVAWGAGGAGAQGNALNGAIGGNGPTNTYGGAGGGGGGGYVRIFASSGAAECATIASPAPGCAKGQLADTPAAP
jgi:hypothetical protein